MSVVTHAASGDAAGPSDATQRYQLVVDVHGVVIEVSADAEGILSAIGSRLDAFPLSSANPAIVYDIAHEPDLAAAVIPDDARTVYDSDLGAVVFVDDGDRLVIDCSGLVRVDARLADGDVVIRYADHADDVVSLVTHPLFTLPLLELMKRRGRYPLHAACVGVRSSRSGATVLLPGASGSGKSTLSVALARAGWPFGSDDMVFLRHLESGLEVLGYPDEVDLTDDSVARFPELAHLVGRATWGSRPKHQVRIDRDLGCELLLTGRPTVLMFPELGGGGSSGIESISPDDALMRLVPNVLLTDAAASQRHLDALAALATSVPAFSLTLGVDLDHAVATVTRHVEAMR